MTNMCKFKVVWKKIMLAIHYVLFFKKMILKNILILKVNLMFRNCINSLLKMKSCVSSQEMTLTLSRAYL